MPHVHWNSRHFGSDIRHEQAFNAEMRMKFIYAVSVSLFGFLLTLPPRVVFCQRQSNEKFVVLETWRNYCPGAEDATGVSYARSKIKCATECILHQGCICFSYYATNRLCYFRSSVPQKMLYDYNCTFMVVS